MQIYKNTLFMALGIILFSVTEGELFLEMICMYVSFMDYSINNKST